MTEETDSKLSSICNFEQMTELARHLQELTCKSKVDGMTRTVAQWVLVSHKSTTFLTPEQKHAIYYNNIARFLRLPEP